LKPKAEARTLIPYVMLAPALLVMTLCGLIPLGFVAYYSVHDTFGANMFVWVGGAWFAQVLTSRDFYHDLLRSFGFTALVLAIEVPLGLYIALRMPTRGALASVYIVLMTIPLLAPTIVVGYLWTALTLPGAGPIYEALAVFGWDLNLNNVYVAWLVLAVMDTWHWTSLIVLLCFAGLRAIPEDYYMAASVDGAGRWALFRHIQLPKIRTVLLVAVLLRFMDSFVIYIEPYVITRGGPGTSTVFLSHKLVQKALVEFNLGEAGAMSMIYFLIVLCVSWAFFRLIVAEPSGQRAGIA
jgi:glycerol transport system permease protein